MTMIYRALWKEFFAISIEKFNWILKFAIAFLIPSTCPSEAFNGGIETNYHGGTHAGTFPGSSL
jgi:hypothetical protein